MKSLLLMCLLSAPALALAQVSPVSAAETTPKRVFIEASLAYNGEAPLKFSNPVASGGRFEVKVLDVPVRYLAESTCGNGLCEEVWQEMEVGQTLAITPKIRDDGKIDIHTDFTVHRKSSGRQLSTTPAMDIAYEANDAVLTIGEKKRLVVLDEKKLDAGATLELTVKVMD